jgi:glycosyltransferase involved in cell wall biosynthesis
VNIKKSKIIILTTQPFPDGLASTSRILSYCKGFLQHGYHPEIFCIRPTETKDNILNSEICGVYHGINFFYPGGTTVRANSFWGRRKNDLVARYASVKAFFKVMKRRDVCFVIFYGNCISVEVSATIISKFFKIIIFKEASENPLVYFPAGYNPIIAIDKWFTVHQINNFYNGILVMTDPLKDFFLKKGIPEHKLLLVPQTVDMERFETRSAGSALTFPYRYIAYIGSIKQEKDGVLTLIESFQDVIKVHSEIHLVIAGQGTKEEEDAMSGLIQRLGLQHRIHFLGQIPSGAIPEFLHGAELLVSCRPDSLQSDYGFPTKIAEYLATGKPVVTTVTGELALFLKDGFNAFVAPEASPMIFASKIIEALHDPEYAKQVGRNGRDLAFDKFNPTTQTKIILDYVNNRPYVWNSRNSLL